MVHAFATAADLAIRLKRPVWEDADEFEQVEAFLADASNDLRGEIGWQVYPPAEITVPAVRDWAGRIVVPANAQGPVTQAVADDGEVWLTYTIGYTEPPDELVKWTCVLAAQALARATSDALGATPSSEALGADYRVSYSELQQSGELPIPERVLQRLRSSYGQSVYVT